MNDQPLWVLYSTVIRVRNLERSREWYETVLDFRVTFVDPHYPLLTLTHADGRTITVWQIEDGITPICTHRNGAYLVFMTPDIEAARREMIRRGGQPEATGNYPGLNMFWLQDPDGHHHAVMQFALE